MDREQKASLVEALRETLEQAKITVVADYRGLKVTEMEQLRRSLRQTNAQIRVAKNTLLRIAAKGTGYEGLLESFTGTTAIAVGFEDPVGAAKALTDFAKEYEAFEIRCGAMDGKLLSKEDVAALAKLPGKDQLRAQLLGVLNGVPTSLVQVLSAAPRNLLGALQAYRDKLEQSAN